MALRPRGRNYGEGTKDTNEGVEAEKHGHTCTQRPDAKTKNRHAGPDLRANETNTHTHTPSSCQHRSKYVSSINQAVPLGAAGASLRPR